MPYIESVSGRRKKLENGEPALTAGELNYQIFYYVKHNNILNPLKIIDFVRNFLGKKPNYQKYNDITGALIRCYKEIKRRLNRDVKLLIEILNLFDVEINNYEDIKIKENGDVL